MPRTEAGKRLLRQIAVDHPTWPEQGLVEAIEAIEREAALPDRDALARALVLTGMYLDASDPLVGLDDPKNIADAIIAALEEP